MADPPPRESERIRQFAKELRERARLSDLPGYAEKLVSAAKELEKRADELEEPG
jgi:hypothetical protein